MYRRPKFLEVLLEIRRQMAHEADYDVDLFTEIARSGARPQISGGRRARASATAESKAETVICELTQPKDI